MKGREVIECYREYWVTQEMGTSVIIFLRYRMRWEALVICYLAKSTCKRVTLFYSLGAWKNQTISDVINNYDGDKSVPKIYYQSSRALFLYKKEQHWQRRSVFISGTPQRQRVRLKLFLKWNYNYVIFPSSFSSFQSLSYASHAS